MRHGWATRMRSAIPLLVRHCAADWQATGTTMAEAVELAFRDGYRTGCEQAVIACDPLLDLAAEAILHVALDLELPGVAAVRDERVRQAMCDVRAVRQGVEQALRLYRIERVS